MIRRARALPPPTPEERETARAAAVAMHAAIADRTAMGARSTAHVDFSRPRCGQWWTTWSGLPGLVRIACSRGGISYEHACLPGWSYARHEIRAELIPDLEALAERGVRPTEATS